MSLELVPVTLAEARTFVGKHHRHNLPPLGWKFGVGVTSNGELRGVAIAGNPKARLLMDGRTLEVTRTCTDGTPNANSMLYGAIGRAAAALGYKRLFTYTLVSEPGSSLKAVGWVPDSEVPADTDWARANRSSVDFDLFGEATRPRESKVRWRKDVA